MFVSKLKILLIENQSFKTIKKLIIDFKITPNPKAFNLKRKKVENLVFFKTLAKTVITYSGNIFG